MHVWTGNNYSREASLPHISKDDPTLEKKKIKWTKKMFQVSSSWFKALKNLTKSRKQPLLCNTIGKTCRLQTEEGRPPFVDTPSSTTFNSTTTLTTRFMNQSSKKMGRHKQENTWRFHFSEAEILMHYEEWDWFSISIKRIRNASTSKKRITPECSTSL